MTVTLDDAAADPQQIIADLRQQLDERTAELQALTAERDDLEQKFAAAGEQQTATAEVLGIINSSPGNLAPVFDAMLEKALRLCEADLGTFWTYDGEGFQVVALRGAPPEQAAFLIGQRHKPGPGTIYDLLLGGDDVVHIPDLADTEAYRAGEPTRRHSVDVAGARTTVAVPLRNAGQLLGLINIYRQEVRPFSDKQIAFLQNFAAQAVIAMENARLINETRDALEQQTATAEVLGVINSSPGDLAPVFEEMLEKATRLCEAAAGTFWISDGEQWRAAAIRGMPAEFMKSARAYRPSPNSPVGRIIGGQELVHFADLAAEEVYRSGDALVRTAVDQEDGIRTLLSVPLRKENKLLGVFSVYRRDVRPFSDKQIALVRSFAAQAVIAMENARLITETRERTRDLQESLEYQTATSDVLKVISRSTFDLQPVLDTLVETAAGLCNADMACLVTRDGDVYQAVADYAVSPEWSAISRSRTWRPGDANVVGRTLLERRVVHVLDVAAEPRHHPEAVTVGGIRTALGVPLLREGDPIGTIHLARRRVEPFTERQIELVRTFADQAVIAIENTRLIAETQEALDQQTATAEVLQVINSSPGDLAPVFDAMLGKAVRLCDAAHGELHTYDGKHFHTVAFFGVSAEYAKLRATMPPSGTPGTGTGRLLETKRPVHVLDAAAGESYLRGEPSSRLVVEVAGVRTSLSVPLLKDDSVVGNFLIYRKEVRPFSEKEITLLQSFAAQAVIAMENARLLGELRQRTEEVADLNRGLEARVAEQVEELGRVGRLKRFLAPQLAELIVSQGDEKILESHRREIVVVFCDLRGYTAFTEAAEPEEVLDFLREYHGALGPLVSQFEGTLDQFSGDGIMVFFNDPVPCPDPAERAVKMAVAMREAAGTLIANWRERGRDLGFGAGIAQGYATLGQIGFSERSGYTAIGTVCNVAARLCAEAKDGQILLGQRVNVALKGSVATEQVGALALKGLTQPVVAYNVPLAATQPALRVIEGGPQNV